MHAFAINDRAAVLADDLAAEAERLRISVATGESGERRLDLGAGVLGSLEAGLAAARVALGGLADVALAAADDALHVTVRTCRPVTACLASQYAGWHLSHDGFSAMGSGPARALAAREALFETLGCRDSALRATLLVEGETFPPAPLVAGIADACRVRADALTLILVPTHSLAGSVQVAARALENAMGKARHLKFPLDDLVEGIGSAPLAPPPPDRDAAMARANDALIYGSRVRLFATGDGDAARRLAEALPSATSTSYGKGFAEVLRAAGGEFYRVDPELFGPAAVEVVALADGRTHRAGRIDAERLAGILAG